ncbi:hypothetical protein ACN47E_000062 [Coniothyrium glycines]
MGGALPVCTLPGDRRVLESNTRSSRTSRCGLLAGNSTQTGCDRLPNASHNALQAGSARVISGARHGPWPISLLPVASLQHIGASYRKQLAGMSARIALAIDS